jgi:hypothetical protein
MAMLWSNPAATWTTSLIPDTSTGLGEFAMAASLPSWPAPSQPHALTPPEVVMARVW